MLRREDLPLLGTVMAGADVYEVREGIAYPVTIWRAGTQVGHVSAYEVQIARDGHVPAIRVGIENTARLAGLHFRLRQAIGALIRDPGDVVHISRLEVKLPQQAQR